MEENIELNLENTDQNGQINIDKEDFSFDEINIENEVENTLDFNDTEQQITTEIDENMQKNNEKQEKNEKKEENSVNLGKFKDVSSLLSAYNNLQAEFTKKCQKLSELTKTCDNNACALPQEQWKEKVDNFLSNNQEAKPYAKEISEILLNNTDLLNSENGLEKAWTKVLMNNVLSLKEKMQDKSFVTDLLNSDEELKQNIINEYVSKLKNKRSPVLMDNNGAFAITKAEKALNLEDASALVRAMFK